MNDYLSDTKNRDKKRVGRGSGSNRGKTCGRGMKGRNARSGSGKRSEGGQTPFHIRYPKTGNASFRSNKYKTYTINLDKQNEHQKSNIDTYDTFDTIKKAFNIPHYYKIIKIIAMNKEDNTDNRRSNRVYVKSNFRSRYKSDNHTDGGYNKDAPRYRGRYNRDDKSNSDSARGYRGRYNKDDKSDRRYSKYEKDKLDSNTGKKYEKDKLDSDTGKKYEKDTPNNNINKTYKKKDKSSNDNVNTPENQTA